MRRVHCVTLIVAAVLVAVGTLPESLLRAADGDAPAGAPLTYTDLIGHPERWPAQVTGAVHLHFSNGVTIEAGQKLDLVSVQPNGVQAQDSTGGRVRLSPQQCDVVAAANSDWAQLTPEQRAITPEALERDPSLLPEKVTITKPQNFPGVAPVKAGTEVDLLKIQEDKVLFATPPQWNSRYSSYLLEMSQTDLMQRARELAKVPHDSRPRVKAEAFLKELADDASLWPDKVAIANQLTFNGGGTIKTGQEVTLMRIKGGYVYFLPPADWHSNFTNFTAEIRQTDIVERAHALAATPKDSRPSAIAAELSGNVVDAKGAPLAVPTEGVKYYAIYYGASWCGPCHQFMPKLLAYYNDTIVKHPEVAIVMVSAEDLQAGAGRVGSHYDADMLGYMSEMNMPWGGVGVSKKAKCPRLFGYSVSAIPYLAVVDRFGTLIFDSDKDGSYYGPELPMNQLKDRLEHPPADTPAH